MKWRVQCDKCRVEWTDDESRTMSESLGRAHRDHCGEPGRPDYADHRNYITAKTA